MVWITNHDIAYPSLLDTTFKYKAAPCSIPIGAAPILCAQWRLHLLSIGAHSEWSGQSLQQQSAAHIDMYAYIHIYIYIYIYIYMYYVYINIYMYIYLYTPKYYVHIYTLICMDMYMYLYIYIYICMHLSACIYFWAIDEVNL